MMNNVPSRVDSNTILWFYEQHRQLWTWISELTPQLIGRIASANPGVSADYSIKMAWPGWGERWGRAHGSFACEVGGEDGSRCFKCPLGNDFCHTPGGPYQNFLEAIRKGDIVGFKASAIAIRDAWKKPAYTMQNNWW